MGYVIVRQRASGRRYTAMYRDVRGKLRSAGTFTTEKQANRAWQKAEVAIASGRIGDPRRGRQRFADYVRVEWFPNHVIERSTRQNYTYVMDWYVVPFFGDLKMIEIMPSDVREWIVKMQAEGARPPTIRRVRTYQHGTLSAYTAGKCHCVHCRDAMAHYRAQRRAGGLDVPRLPRIVESDGHIPKDWFRRSVWEPALAGADLGFRLTPHGLRHAHASWLLAGGADIQIVKERLGHGSIMTTEKYLHSLPGADDAALAAFNAIRGRRPTGGPADNDAVEVRDVGEARALV